MPYEQLVRLQQQTNPQVNQQGSGQKRNTNLPTNNQNYTDKNYYNTNSFEIIEGNAIPISADLNELFNQENNNKTKVSLGLSKNNGTNPNFNSENINLSKFYINSTLTTISNSEMNSNQENYLKVSQGIQVSSQISSNDKKSQNVLSISIKLKTGVKIIYLKEKDDILQVIKEFIELHNQNPDLIQPLCERINTAVSSIKKFFSHKISEEDHNLLSYLSDIHNKIEKGQVDVDGCDDSFHSSYSEVNEESNYIRDENILNELESGEGVLNTI